MDKIVKLRNRIDEIDNEIMSLLNERYIISDQIGDNFKKHFNNDKLAGESSIKKIVSGLFQYEYNFKEFSRKLLKIYSSLIKKSCCGLSNIFIGINQIFNKGNH